MGDRGDVAGALDYKEALPGEALLEGTENLRDAFRQTLGAAGSLALEVWVDNPRALALVFVGNGAFAQTSAPFSHSVSVHSAAASEVLTLGARGL